MVELRVWDCVIVLPVQLPDESDDSAALLAPLPVASCLIVTDWCACRSAFVNFPFVFVFEPSRLMFWVTQALLSFEPLDCCVINAVYRADWTSPDTFWVFS